MDFLKSEDVEELQLRLESTLALLVSNIHVKQELEEKLEKALAEIERLRALVKE